MRTGLLIAAFLAALAPPAAVAADPAVVYQTQPVGRLLDEARAAANSMGGQRAVKEFNAEIKRALGEKGFDGVDINRPIVGYVDIPADPMNAVAVVALPVTGEKEFLAFCERWNNVKPKPLKGGLYEVPALGPGLKAVVRVTDGYAYIATGTSDPARVLDAKTLVPAATLYDPTETALMTGRVYFDRIPAEVRAKITDLSALMKASLLTLSADTGEAAKKALGEFVKLGTRYLELGKGAKEAAVRVTYDPEAGDLTAEATLTAVPGSPLANELAARKSKPHRFAALVTPDAVMASVARLPFFEPELREAAVIGLDRLRDEAKNGPAQPRAMFDEILKGLIRTVKTDEVDFAYVLRGPAKDGTFSGVVAVSFDDPSGVEKELKKVVEAELPPEFKDALKWDAAKAGGVSIHTLTLTKLGGFTAGVQRLFGEDATVAVAFAPKAVYVAVGPDAVATITAAMAAKPGDAPGLSSVVNPARMTKFMAATETQPGNAGKAARVWGTEDKLLSVMSLAVGGEKELKLKLGVNLKLYGRAALLGGAGVGPDDEPEAK